MTRAAKKGGNRPKVSNAKAAKADRPKAARAAARPAPGPGRGRGGAQSTRGANRKAAPVKATEAGPTTGRGKGRGGPERDPLRIKPATRGLGGDQVEGRQAVRELLLAGTRKVHEVWLASDQDEAFVLDDIGELAMSLGVPVRTSPAPSCTPGPARTRPRASWRWPSRCPRPISTTSWSPPRRDRRRSSCWSTA
jgi:23S rRNA (guanosine2251-2'-O)-methyltransferase